MIKFFNTVIFLLILTFAYTQELKIISVNLSKEKMEVGENLEINCYSTNGKEDILKYKFSTKAGKIKPTNIPGQVIFTASNKIGLAVIDIEVTDGKQTVKTFVNIDVVPKGKSSPWATVLFTVDTNTLKNVHVDSTHTQEKFVPPLKIKGELTLDESSGEAQAGGSWPTYIMYDDGTHGDKTANDGIWSISMKFEKSDRKVHFAFDDGNDYRVGFESGLTKIMKDNWTFLDEFPEDNTNPAFVPNEDKNVSWDSEKAKKADSEFVITKAKYEIKNDKIVYSWEPYATFYGKKVETYQLYLEGPFDTKQSDIKNTKLLRETKEISVEQNLSDITKGKYYYVVVIGKNNKKDYVGKPVEFIIK